MRPELGAAIGLALIDSLNPATISEAGVLSGTRRPVATVLAYWAGALVCYLALGVLMVVGLGPLVGDLLRDPPPVARVLEVVGGGAALVAGALLWRRRSGLKFGTRLASGDPRFAFRFGMLITLGDLPTAAPYYAAVGLLAGSGLSQLEQLGALVVYNLVYLAPVLGVLAVRLALGRRADRPLAAMRRAIERWAGTVLAVFLVLGGGVLVLDGLAALI